MSKNHSLIALLLVATVFGCGKTQSQPASEAPSKSAEESKNKGEVSLSEESAKESGIETAVVRSMLMQAELKVAGTVTSTANGRAIVTSSLPGKIIRLFVAAGEKVGKGQSLAILESPELAQAASAVADADRLRLASNAEVDKASAELDLAEGRLRTSQAQLSRQNALAKAGAFSQPSLQAAIGDVNTAEAELQSAKADEAVHKVQLERATRLFSQELIARTELEQARLVLSQDEVRRDRAKKRQSVASDTLRREQEIASKGLLTAREVQTAEGDARAANLEVQRAKIGLAAAQASLVGAKRAVDNARNNYAAVRGMGNGGDRSSVTLTAPIAGTITERKATIGQAVERSSELFEIENLDTVWVIAKVPEKDVVSVERGLNVRITAAAFPDRIFEGVVQLLGNHLDAKTRTMPVQCLVENKGGLLREDMFATVLLGVGHATTALVVPDAAIIHRSHEESVFVQVGRKYERRPVKTGRSAGGFTEIVSGLKAGERVVSKGLFVIESESRKDELKGED